MADAAPALPPPPSPMRMSAASFTRQDGRAVETENHNTNDGETNSADGLAPGERMPSRLLNCGWLLRYTLCTKGGGLAHVYSL